MRFDILVSMPGFNKTGLLAENIAAEEIGPLLEKVLDIRAKSHYEGGDKLCGVTVHVHPTFWSVIGPVTFEQAVRRA